MDMKLNTLKYIFFTILLMFLSATAYADSVEIEYIDKTCVVGETLSFNIKISVDDGNADKRIDVSRVQINGVPLKYEVRESGSQSFTVVINGRTIRQSAGFIKNYVFEIPTTKTGDLRIPGFDVKVGDKTYTSESLKFKVYPKPTSSDLLFKVYILNPQHAYYPTQIIELENRIYFRNFPGSPSIENIQLPIMQNKAFSLIPDKYADRTVIINQERVQINPRQGSEVINGKQYNFFAFPFKFRLMESGVFRFNNSLKMIVETGEYSRQRGFFGTQLVKEKKAMFADSPILQITVRQLPEDNVPASFNGAIGEFNIRVIPSSDTGVRVGDPITLSIEIVGRGTWEFVKSPPVHRFREVTDYFKVSKDPIAGEVSTDNTRKTFLVRMRVKSKTVKEIPAIPFTYFNLRAEKYVTVYSKSVPISVYETSSDVQIVDYSKLQEQSKQEAAVEIVKNEEQQKQTIEALIKQELLEPIQIADSIDGAVLNEDHSVHYYRILYACFPFAMVILLFSVNSYKNRDVSVEKRVRVKAKGSYKNLLKDLSRLKKRHLDSSVFYRDLGRTIHKFVEERFGVKIDTLDKDVVNDIVEAQKLSRENAETLIKLYEEIDYRRYSSAGFDPEVAKSLRKKTKEVLKRC